jgi:hypothetical protein
VGSAGLRASDPRRVREGEAFVNSVVDLEGIALEGVWPSKFRCAAAFDGGDHGSDLRLEISGRCEKGEAEERP